METDITKVVSQTQGVVNGDNQENNPPTPATDGSVVKQPEQTEDLLSRVSKVNLEETKPKAADTDEAGFDYSKLGNIKTPDEAKAWAENAYKSFQRGFNEKYQDLAQKRKDYEARLDTIRKWTPERLKEELNNPEFVKVAQDMLGWDTQQSNESYPYDEDKKQFAMVQNQIRTLNQQNAQLLKKQEDEALKVKFANYNPGAIDTLTAELLEGKVQATRESLHKVLDYENAVKRAYQLGLQDRKLELGDKVNSMSAQGGQATSGYQPPPPKENEKTSDYLIRCFEHRKQHSGKQANK